MSDFGKFWGSGFGKGVAGYLSGSLHIREFVALDGKSMSTGHIRQTNRKGQYALHT